MTHLAAAFLCGLVVGAIVGILIVSVIISRAEGG